METGLRFAGAWTGTAYRFVTVHYSNRQDLLSGAGSRAHGGRWNPPDHFSVVYGSLSPQAAVAESLSTSGNFGIPPAKVRPRVFAAIEFALQSVLDLTNPKVAKRLALDFDKLFQEDWNASQDAGHEAMSQALGRIAWELKLEGIIVPSAVVSQANNIAVFPGRRLRASSWKFKGLATCRENKTQPGTPDSSR